MEAGLFPFIFDIDFTGALMVKEHLSEDEFEVVLVHVHMRARNLIISHIREVEGCAIAVTGLRDGVDVSAALEVLDIFLGA